MKSDKFDLGMIYSTEYLNGPTQVEDWNRIKEVYNSYINSEPRDSVIPKIIHQIWLGGDLPDKQKNACRDIQAVCNENGWSYRLWRDSDVLELGDFKNKELFNSTPNLGQKSDILRNIILHKYGGVYLDTDYIIVKLFDDLLDLDFFCGVCFDNWPSMSNSIIGTIPAGDTITSMLTYEKEISWNDGMAIIDTTGPYHTTRAALKNLSSKTVVFPNSYFYPYPCFPRLRVKGTDPMQYISSETYCIHLWDESWNKTF
jgi:mannosyltransferase OCH1-like enzyme